MRLSNGRAREDRLGANREALQRYSLAVLSHLLLVAAWHFFVVLGKVPNFVMPSPLRDAQRAAGSELSLAREHRRHRVGDLRRLCSGGRGRHRHRAAVLLVPLARDVAIMPLLVSLNMIPKVALGPLIIVWFKYGIGPNIMMAFAICFFPIVLTTARGLREVEPDLLDLVRTLKGSRWQVFTKIQLPGALPYIFSGMKVAAILAVAGAIVGEFLGSDRGLGYLMLQVQVTLDTAAMFMAVILITLIGVHALRLVLGLERLLVVQRRAARMSAMAEPFIHLAGVQEGLPHARRRIPRGLGGDLRRRGGRTGLRWSGRPAAARPRC